MSRDDVEWPGMPGEAREFRGLDALQRRLALVDRGLETFRGMDPSPERPLPRRRDAWFSRLDPRVD